MSTRVYLSERDSVVAPEEATVSVFDRGFLFGDGVFETLRTAGDRLVDGAAHLSRLARSAERVGIELPGTASEIERILLRTHAATGNADSRIRAMVTRGRGPLVLDPRTAKEPTLVVIAQELVLPAEDAYRRGISVAVVGAARSAGDLLDATVKSANYLANILALRVAAEKGADDAILCTPEGTVAEGATSNVFCVVEGRLVTPPLDGGLLPGITRDVVCELARSMGLCVEERAVTPEELSAADEVFLTSSVRGIMPVTRVDGRRIGRGEEGPVTARLRRAYRARIDALAAGP